MPSMKLPSTAARRRGSTTRLKAAAAGGAGGADGDELGRLLRAAALSELTRTLAHEINQPLGAIQCNAHAARVLLSGGATDVAEIIDALDDIVASNRRAAEIVRRIGRLAAGPRPRVEVLDLGDIAREAARLAAPVATQRGVDLSLALADEALPVLADGTQLVQAAVHLLLNAVEAAAERPAGERRAALRTAGGAARVELFVTDSGAGVPAELLPRLCEAFVSTKPGHAGLGLSLCRSVAESHGGALRIEARPGGGTLACLSLPPGDPGDRPRP